MNNPKLNISLSNFKGFSSKQDFQLRKFNLFMGANNTGKSTLKSWFKLISDNSTNIKYQLDIKPTKENKNQFKNLLNRNGNSKEVVFEIPVTLGFGDLLVQYTFKEVLRPKSSGFNDSCGNLSYITILFNDEKLAILDTEEFTINAKLLSQILINLGKDQFGIIGSSFFYANSNFDLKTEVSKFSYLDDWIKCGNAKLLLQSILPREYRREFHLELDVLLKNFKIEFDIMFIIGLQNFFSTVLGQLDQYITGLQIIENDTSYLEEDIDEYGFESVAWNDYYKYLKTYAGIESKILEVSDTAGHIYGHKLQVFNGLNWYYLEELGDGFRKYINLICNTILSASSFNVKYIFIEEPENTLHPDLEIKYVDFLIDVFKKSDSIIVLESHSLNILRAFQLAVANDKIDSDQIRIYDFYNDNNDQNVNKNIIEIEDNGMLSSLFHNGFTDVTAKMEMELWEIQQKILSKN